MVKDRSLLFPSSIGSPFWRLRGDCKNGIPGCCSPMGVYLAIDLLMSLSLSEQGKREVERGVTVEQLARMCELL